MLTIKQIADIIRSEVMACDACNLAPGFETAAQKIHELCAPDHTIHVAAAQLENEVTSMLVNMVAATVLAMLLEEEGGGRTNIRLSPGGMQEMLTRWNFTVEHEGMDRTILITPKDDNAWQEGEPPSKLASLLMSEQEDVSNAKPQAEPHVYDRPIWAISYFDQVGNPMLANMHDRADAQRHLADYTFMGRPAPVIENRHCLHVECPSSRCNVWKDDDEKPGNGMNPDGN